MPPQIASFVKNCETFFNLKTSLAIKVSLRALLGTLIAGVQAVQEGLQDTLQKSRSAGIAGVTAGYTTGESECRRCRSNCKIYYKRSVTEKRSMRNIDKVCWTCYHN